MRAILLAAATAAALAAVGSAVAAPLHVEIDHSARLQVAGSAASVVVGNPAIADVTVVDSHNVFVSGRAFGDTDVVVLDSTGRTLLTGEISVGAANQGQVAVYRGGERTDLACAPGCQTSARSGGAKPGQGGGGAPAPAAAATAGALAGALAGGLMSSRAPS